jgi:C-terminal processing protease CtpA/Prc
MMNNIMAVLQDPAPRILASSGQWGLIVSKADADEEAGVTVKEVRPGSPAAAAGLKVGDRLLTLDGRWTDTVADTYIAAGFVKAGTAAKVVARRDGKEVELTVTPAQGCEEEVSRKGAKTQRKSLVSSLRRWRLCAKLVSASYAKGRGRRPCGRPHSSGADP